MKNIFYTLLAVCFCTAGFAQTPINLPALSPYSENFDVTPGASGTTYPSGWVAYNFATTLDNAMTTGSSSSTTGANYNYGSCIGILGSGSNYLPGTLVLAIANTTGKKNFKISYNVKKIREQTRNNTFNLQVSTVSATSSFTDVTGGLYDSGTIPQGTTTAYTNIALPSTFDNKSTTVYIRLYYSDIAGSGSRDGIALDDVVLSWSPLGPEISAPSLQNLGDVSARLGANVTSDGGNTVTQRGIVLDTIADPEVGKAGVLQFNVDGTTGLFDTLITGLMPGKRYYFRGFATNASGTGYTDNSTFYTLSLKPGAVTGLTATAISDHDIRLDWTPPSVASGYLVLQKLYTAPTGLPQNATAYTEGVMIGDGEVIDTITTGSINTKTYGSLVSGTIYYYSVIPYRFNGVNTETYHYNTDVPVPTAFDTTWGVGPSAISDLVGVAASEALTISSVSTGALTTATSGTKVWQLALRDGGSLLSDADNMPTTITRMVITRGNLNKANWQSTLDEAALFDDSTGNKLGDAVVYNDSLVFGSILFQASDNNQKTATLRISLKTSGIKDMDTLQFAVKKQNVRTLGLNQSSQIPSIDISSDSLKNVIDVVATKFVITQQPAPVVDINAMLPQPVIVELRDSNNNLDTYNNGVYQLTSATALLKYLRFEKAVNGVLYFDSVAFTTLATGNILKISGNNIDTAYTTPVNIVASALSSISVTGAFAYTDSISYIDFQSADITAGNAVDVFGITINDGGSSHNDPDNFGTALSSLTINTGNHIYVRRLALYQGTTELAEVPVNAAAVTFNNLNVLCNDNDSLALTLRATFNSRYAHGQRVTFTVTKAVADTSQGSVFAAADAGNATSSVTGANNVLKLRKVYVTPPVVNSPHVCAGAGVLLTAAKPAGLSVKWYAQNDTVLALHTGDTFDIGQVFTGTIYYAATDSAGWLSSLVPVPVNVQTVAAPVFLPIAVCPGTPAGLSVTSAASVKWYRSMLSNIPVATGNTFNAGSINNDTVFYVQADSAGCTSGKLAFQVRITRVSLPVVKDTMVCKTQTVALHAQGTNTINWYASATATTALQTGNTLNTGSLISDTTFYAEADSSGCRSIRVPLHVSVKQVAAPVFLPDSMVICEGQQVVLTTTRQADWFDAPAAVTPLTTNDSLTTGILTTTITYYARYTEQGCNSALSPVKVVVNPKPVAPVLTADSVCMGTSGIINAVGTTAFVSWFDAASGGNLLATGNKFTTPVLNTNTSYFAQSESKGCMSGRVVIELKTKVRPAAPSVTANAIACSGTQLKLGASAPQGTIKWFASATDTAAIGSDTLLTTPLVSDVKYYAAAERNGCLSNRQVINVKVNQTPDAVFSVNDEDQCMLQNQFTFINAGNPQATQYSWNFGDSTTFAFMNPVKTYQAKGTYTVKLKAVNSGCSSEFSKVVSVNAPDVNFTFQVTGTSVTFTSLATGIASYKWLFTATDSSTQQNPVHTFTQNGTYQVTLIVTDNNGCSSAISKQVVITSVGLNDAFETTYRMSLYPNPASENANLSYTLVQESEVHAALFDAQGKLVDIVFEGTQPRGGQQVNIRTAAYAKGLYLLRIRIGNDYKTMKLEVR
jgi:PKD repeat protein